MFQFIIVEKALKRQEDKKLFKLRKLKEINQANVSIKMPVDINNLTEGWLELESDPGEFFTVISGKMLINRKKTIEK